MVSDRAFIFHTNVPWDKTLPIVVPKPRSFVKVKNQGHSFGKKIAIAGKFVFYEHIF